MRREGKERANATDKNLNYGFRAYLRRVGNLDRDRVVLKRGDMDQKGDNSDSKGLEVVDHHIRCSRVVSGLDHRDWDQDQDQDHCMRDRLVFGDSDSAPLLCHDNRLSRASHLCHQRICGICLDRQEDRPCGQDFRNLLRRMDDVGSWTQ